MVVFVGITVDRSFINTENEYSSSFKENGLVLLLARD